MQKRKQTPDGVANNLFYTLYYVTRFYIICAAQNWRSHSTRTFLCFSESHLFPVTFSFEKTTLTYSDDVDFTEK